MSKKTTKQAFYNRAASEHGYVYSEQMDYKELVFQLNRGSDFGQGRWNAVKNGNQVIIKCEGEKVLTLFKQPQHFVANFDAQPVTIDPYAEDMGNGANFDGEYVGFAPYELAIVYHFLRKENWSNWFEKEVIAVSDEELSLAIRSFDNYATLVSMGRESLDDEYLRQLATSVKHDGRFIDHMWEFVECFTTNYNKQQFANDIA